MIKRLLVLSAFASACQTQDPPSRAEPQKKNVAKASSQSIRVTDMLEEVLPSPDRQALAIEDAAREAAGMAPRYAVTHAVSHAPTWVPTARGEQRFRMRIRSPGASSLAFGFSQYRLPQGATLTIYNDRARIRTFDDRDNRAHGQLWTPILRGEEAVIELSAPGGTSPALLLSTVNIGYRDLAKSGECNVDVVCAQGDDWRKEIRAVAAISTGGGLFCSGFLVNSEDGRDYFMTAHHCGIDAESAPSLVTYWNYETSTCGGTPDGTLEQFTTGATWRAGGAPSDFELVELDAAPESGFNVHWAGWDATGTPPKTFTGIHHPNVEEKRISFSSKPGTLTSWPGGESPGDGTHWRVQTWDVGTTEPGSSGSGVWNQDHRIVGQLHGGEASCDAIASDYYGNFSVSYDAGLRPFLSPSGARTMDGRDQCPAPKVSFAIADNPAQAGEEVRFSSEVSGGTAPYTYAWDLDGDGAFDCTEASCAQAFSGNLRTDTRLVVSDATGCAATLRHHFTVVDPECPPTAPSAEDLPLAIEDFKTITSHIQGPELGHVATLRVSLSIKHTYRRDLRVVLVAPSGKQLVLTDEAGGSAHDYVLENTTLAAFQGEATSGTWTLNVSDSGEGDTGSLETFSLDFTGTCR